MKLRQFPKMTDSMKFGPEWLRNLDGNPAPTPRYELAEFRYGKEEMLALFDPSVKPPDTLLAIPSLLIEKTQTPLTLAPMTEDETRMWNRSVNSEAVLRLAGKAPPGNGSSGGGSLVAGPGGRGGGRGSLRGTRGGVAGGGIPFHYSRTLSYDESAGDGSSCPDGPPPFQRNLRSFERSQMDRSWNERNGAETTDWNGSTSPRKEYGQRGSVGGGGGVGGNPNSGGVPGGSSFDNWRRPHRGGGEEEEGWRTSRAEKWSRYSSWRDGEKETSYEKDSSFKYRNISDGRENNRRPWDDGPRGHHMGSGPGGGGGGNHRGQVNHDDDALPEWATEHADGGGSFDSSGAFHHITGIGGPGSSNTIGGGGGGGGGAYTDDECDESMAATSRKKRQPSDSELIRGNRPKGSIQHNSASEDTPPPPPAPTIHDSSRSSAKINIEVLQTSKSIPSISTSTTTSVTSTKKSKEAPPNSLSITNSSPPLTTSSSHTNAISTSPASKFKPNQSSSPEMNSESFRSNHHEQLESSTLSIESNLSTTMPLQATGPTHKTMFHDHRHMNTRQTSTDDQLEHMNETVVDLVSKLIEETHQAPPPPPPPPIGQHQQQYQQHATSVSVPPPQNVPYGGDKWFYRDPQGEVQGPFTSAEMNEWFRAGYFGLNLLVRRVCDERYSLLGDLAKICGQIPFLPGFTLPPFKGPEPNLVTETQAPPPLTTKMSLDHDYMQHYQFQQQFLQRQLILGAGTLNAQPNIMQSRPTATHQPPPSAPPNYLPSPPKHNNPLMNLINQYQHHHQAPQTSVTNSNQSETKTSQNIQKLEPIQQIIQQMGGLQGNPAVIQTQPQPQAPTNIPSTNINDPNKIQNMLSQIALQHKTQQELWLSQEQQVAAAALAAGFPGWLGVNPSGQHAPHQPAPPPPTSLWGDIEPVLSREIKTTESNVLEQQLIRKAEIVHQEEEKNCLPLKEPIDEMKERMRLLEEDRKKKEEEKRRILADQLIQEEKKMKRKEEEKRKAEEQRKAEEAARKREEAARKKEEEKELKRKAEEEAKRKAAEEEAAAISKQKMEEEAARQQRRQAEALRRLQEQQQRQSRPSPWCQPSSSASTIVAPVADIQRQEREKKEREIQQQILANIQIQQQQEAALAASIMVQGSSNGAGTSSNIIKPSLQLKWADKKQVSTPRVKSLAEIQQEEAEKERKEREKTERAQQQAKETATSSTGLTNTGIWGLASQSLSWATTTAVNSQSTSQSSSAWGTTRQQKSVSGFWDETPAPTSSTKNKASNKAQSGSVNSVNTGSSEKTMNNKNTSNDSSKNTKDQALVLKLFEQHTSVDDEFSEWCTKTLTTFDVHLDIPTFVVFLRDIESPYEVKDYVREFLGDSRESSEFANQFLERRSSLKRAAKAQTGNRPNKPDDLNVPAQALNPNGGSGLAPDFHEVKGKNKKSKKNKMIKVDHRILGFNVTASQDRINVGDRDYVEM